MARPSAAPMTKTTTPSTGSPAIAKAAAADRLTGRMKIMQVSGTLFTSTVSATISSSAMVHSGRIWAMLGCSPCNQKTGSHSSVVMAAWVLHLANSSRTARSLVPLCIALKSFHDHRAKAMLAASHMPASTGLAVRAMLVAPTRVTTRLRIRRKPPLPRSGAICSVRSAFTSSPRGPRPSKVRIGTCCNWCAVEGFWPLVTPPV